jgi:hypothetical protein
LLGVYNPVWESELAEFAFEGFPAIRLDSRRIAFLKGTFGVKPLSQALDMDVLHSTRTFTGANEWISLFVVLLAQADSADGHTLLLNLAIFVLVSMTLFL